MVKHQPRGVVVLVGRSAPGYPGTPRIRPVRRRARRLVVHGVPEVSAAVRGSIVASMVKVDIADVVRELVPERPPPALPGRQEPGDQARDGIVLIVVVRNQRGIASCRLVI